MRAILNQVEAFRLKVLKDTYVDEFATQSLDKILALLRKQQLLLACRSKKSKIYMGVKILLQHA
jgi:predicted RNA binding protein with dsRBD fold (UPF0201 family)